VSTCEKPEARALQGALSEGVTLRVAYLLLHYVASSQRQ